MAKALQLVNTNLREVSVLVDSDGHAVVRIVGEVLDSGDSTITMETMASNFENLPVQIRAALNNALRLISKDFNQAQVNENKETWLDR